MRAHRARRRLLRSPQALSQRGLLYRPDLSVDGFSGDDVPGAVRHPAHLRVDRPVGRDAARRRAEDCAPAAGVLGPRAARLHPHRPALLASDPLSGALCAAPPPRKKLKIGTNFGTKAVPPRGRPGRGNVARSHRRNLLLEFKVPSDPKLLSVVRSAIEKLAAVVGLPEGECRSVTLAV